jgi:RNA polymerase sigma factor (sigma-70 family)
VAARDAELVETRQRFLDYLTRRVGDRALAEDILQDAFVRNIDRLQDLPGEAFVPWFYRTLRNASVDHFRRQKTAALALAALANEVQRAEAAAEPSGEICTCVGRLADTLKPEYADALRAIDVDDVPVKAFAEQRGITPSSAGVRVFRARKALRTLVVRACGVCADRGCLDCSCASASAEPPPAPRV